MKSRTLLFLATIIVLFLNFILGCDKKEDTQPPAISFKIDDSFTDNNAVVQVGHSLKFGIFARSGSADLTNFTVKKHLPDGTILPVMDTGIFTKTLDLEKVFYQNVEDTVIWKFSVMDRNRVFAEVELTIYRDPNSSFGGIYYHQNIIMAYQENEEFGHFLNATTGKVYTNDSATMFQEDVDVLVYYIYDEDLPSPVLSSPGEMDNFGAEANLYYPQINSWETRNYTTWDISVDNDSVPIDKFEQAHNDSLLIVTYNEVWGKKKFKWATTGRVIPFMTNKGKKGLIKIVNAELVENGTITFDIKIQQ